MSARYVQVTCSMVERVAADTERYMSLLSVRQKLVASNIANADTPGYHTKDINFQEEFQNAISGTNPTVVETQGLYMKNDGNNVNMDREMRLLSENDMRFSLASNLVRSELKSVRLALDGGSQG